ncbi:MAG TPA: hypothetical protein VMW36_08790 [Patescibacteria group bacterium]|nr:hypothetical protein [Patescibacteria group bacterium]
MTQFYMRKYLGNVIFELVEEPRRQITDALYRMLKCPDGKRIEIH